MKKMIIIIVLLLLIILTLMFCEYRYIMHNQHIEVGAHNTVYSTVFGVTDVYDIY